MAPKAVRIGAAGAGLYEHERAAELDKFFTHGSIETLTQTNVRSELLRIGFLKSSNKFHLLFSSVDSFRW